MMNFLSKKYAEVRLASSRVSRNEFTIMIEEAKKEYGVSEKVSYNTIKIDSEEIGLSAITEKQHLLWRPLSQQF